MKKYKGVATLEVLQHAKNYNTWIAETFLTHIQAPVLEIGAGTGNLSSFFLHKTPFHMSDVDNDLVEKMKKRFGKKKHIHFHKYNILKQPPAKFVEAFSSVIGINVLEHIEDDSKALQHLSMTLQAKGTLLLLVPAMKLAYTRFDRELGHYRRYTKKELLSLLQRNGFLVEDIYYFNIVGLISWIIRDKVERSSVHLKPYQVAAFDSIVPVLRKIETAIRPPIGVSLIAIARKK